jgi:hypothetical protein
MFIYVNFKRIGNFFIWISSILVTTYAVPPRGRRPYTDAHLLFCESNFLYLFEFSCRFSFVEETLLHPTCVQVKAFLNWLIHPVTRSDL